VDFPSAFKDEFNQRLVDRLAVLLLFLLHPHSQLSRW
jgi:hypothetical protein